MLGLYYLFIFIMVGVVGSLSIILNYDIELDNPLKYIFMYQYVIYDIVKDSINVVGIILLEIFVTFSVWFLNIIIAMIIIVLYIFCIICGLFFFAFKKRQKIEF